MSFWNKLRNWTRGKGWKEDEQLEQELYKKPQEDETLAERRKTREIEDLEPENIPKEQEETAKGEIKEAEKNIQEKKKKPVYEETPDLKTQAKEEKKEDTKGISQIPLKHLTEKGKEEAEKEIEEIKTTQPKEYKQKTKKLTEAQIQQEIEDNIQTITETNWTNLGTIADASYYQSFYNIVEKIMLNENGLKAKGGKIPKWIIIAVIIAVLGGIAWFYFFGNTEVPLTVANQTAQTITQNTTKIVTDNSTKVVVIG